MLTPKQGHCLRECQYLGEEKIIGNYTYKLEILFYCLPVLGNVHTSPVHTSLKVATEYKYSSRQSIH